MAQVGPGLSRATPTHFQLRGSGKDVDFASWASKKVVKTSKMAAAHPREAMRGFLALAATPTMPATAAQSGSNGRNGSDPHTARQQASSWPPPFATRQQARETSSGLSRGASDSHENEEIGPLATSKVLWGASGRAEGERSAPLCGEAKAPPRKSPQPVTGLGRVRFARERSERPSCREREFAA